MSSPATPVVEKPVSASPEKPTSQTPQDAPTEEQPKPVELTPEEEFRRKEELYLDTIREQGQKLTELTELVRKRDEPPPPEASAEDFFKSPVMQSRKIVREELDAAIKPLKDFIAEFKSGSAYDRLKAKFKADPRFTEVFANYEALIDEAMSKNEPTDNAMLATISGIIGAASLGLLGGRAAPSTPARPNVATPPHLRPSAPLPPSPPDGKPKQRALTENERRLARERSMTDEQYLSWIDVKPEDVIRSKVGREEKK